MEEGILKLIIVMFLVSMTVLLILPMVDDNTRADYLPEWLQEYYWYFFFLWVVFSLFVFVKLI